MLNVHNCEWLKVRNRPNAYEVVSNSTFHISGSGFYLRQNTIISLQWASVHTAEYRTKEHQ